ncbi:MAG: hypothetical protein ABJN75_08865 [Hoeflea sp.]|uniref:hypothetical protein n=1 Tax=Hoeflea sp. TaxID=1940281 RepID=UPI003297B14B|tara:strand:+ start:27226 stop:27525 length:300 start_codon:yes stop_codon:yes gene_type:complete
MTTKTAKQLCADMIMTASLALFGLIPAARADAQPTYDRRIEEAAIRMLQPKLGDIRGSLDLNTEDHLFPPLSERPEVRKQARIPAALLTGHSEGSLISY